MSSVTFDNATRLYPGGTRAAVDKLNLEVADGEFLVLVGPSGCGKSTSLRMLAGLEEVNDGRILIGDRDVTDVPPKDRDIAMVFQNYALYPHMTVAENMGFPLKLAGENKATIREKVEQAAQMLELTQHLERAEALPHLPDIDRRHPSSRPRGARPGQSLETAVSFEVMNSSSAGTPCLVFSMPRRMAGTISDGSVTRSPWPPKARAMAA